MENQESLSVIIVSVPTNDAGQQIAQELLSKQLVACVNIIPVISSHYRWQGAIEHSTESLLLIKTRSALFERVRECVLELHPYDVPEVVELKVSSVHEAYAKWVCAETLT